MARLTNEQLEKIKSDIALVTVATGHGLVLKKKGRRHWACCPFHEEKTPSFAIDEVKNSFHCHGCGADGDVIDLQLRFMHGTFIEAVMALNERFSVLPNDVFRPVTEPQRIDMETRKALTGLHDFAQNQIINIIGRSSTLSLFNRHGLSVDIARRFTLGFLPKGAVPKSMPAAMRKKLMPVLSKSNCYVFPLRNRELEVVGMICLPEHSEKISDAVILRASDSLFVQLGDAESRVLDRARLFVVSNPFRCLSTLSQGIRAVCRSTMPDAEQLRRDCARHNEITIDLSNESLPSRCQWYGAILALPLDAQIKTTVTIKEGEIIEPLTAWQRDLELAAKRYLNSRDDYCHCVEVIRSAIPSMQPLLKAETVMALINNADLTRLPTWRNFLRMSPQQRALFCLDADPTLATQYPIPATPFAPATVKLLTAWSARKRGGDIKGLAASVDAVIAHAHAFVSHQPLPSELYAPALACALNEINPSNAVCLLPSSIQEFTIEHVHAGG